MSVSTKRASTRNAFFSNFLPTHVVDRARIFANHAFHSPHVTLPMRKALLHDEAYLKIVDHPNYNPRIIEWITRPGR